MTNYSKKSSAINYDDSEAIVDSLNNYAETLKPQTRSFYSYDLNDLAKMGVDVELDQICGVLNITMDVEPINAATLDDQVQHLVELTGASSDAVEDAITRLIDEGNAMKLARKLIQAKRS